ncbi:hypothetical protein N752_25025 [Desulforamulus aquiferis]|nr:hypothetical protein N752_25025 [Desulforamulus aquiferis]
MDLKVPTRNIYCGNCEKEVLGVAKEDNFEYPVRNLVCKINGKRLFCPDCGNELFHREYDEANQRIAFELYRKETGIISPKEIKDIREKYDLTQREFHTYWVLEKLLFQGMKEGLCRR